MAMCTIPTNTPYVPTATIFVLRFNSAPVRAHVPPLGTALRTKEEQSVLVWGTAGFLRVRVPLLDKMENG